MRKDLDFIMKGGLTKRYHTTDTLRSQNVAEHSFFVAWLICFMYADSNHLQSTMCFALAHDVAEGHVGDVSSPVKRANPALKLILDDAENEAWLAIGRSPPPISTVEKRMLKMADNMEGMLFCCRERAAGNKAVQKVYDNYRSYTLQLNPVGKELALLTIIEEKWNVASQR